MKNKKPLFALRKKNGEFIRISEFWDLDNGCYEFDGILVDSDVQNLTNVAREFIEKSDRLEVVEINIEAVNTLGKVKDQSKGEDDDDS
jgi:hypothetical protein